MKAKILAALKTKYKDLGLSDAILTGVAETLAATTTEEDQIDTSIEGVSGLLKGFQSEVDKRVTDAVNKAKKPQPKTETESTADNQEATESKKDEAEMPAWAKALVDKISKIEQGETIQTRKQVIEAKLKDANPAFRAEVLKDFGRMNFADDEDFNTFVEDKVTAAGEFAKSEASNTLGAFGRPIKPAGTTKDEASKEEVDSIVNAIM